MTVQNQRSAPATIYVDYGSFDRRLGRVPALMVAVIPPDALFEATLTVDNPRGVPVTVFAEPGTYDVRLGQVPACSRLTLRFPQSVVLPNSSLRVFVHPEGGPDLSSQLLKVAPGEHLALRVPPR
ncbi:hypothetical protein J421_5060 (plasmid) [Gemmatirosa kalamazoonensis]|uniref:Uncharacterized protein n=1 Tax=Gemmatirosa kalamazoonensis TaxID=861299 RepID=W0RQG9_9BACT|nr:hypothetical protein J421_5060 [Gemmatirosa kalamazoonensis]